MSTVEQVVSHVKAEVVTTGKLDVRNLRKMLYERDDNIADILRLAALQFGLFEEIVAKVLMDAGLGTPVSDEVRQIINHNFMVLMDRLRTEQEGQQ